MKEVNLDLFQDQKLENLSMVSGGRRASVEGRRTVSTTANGSQGDTWYDDSGDGIPGAGDTINNDDGTQICM